METQEEIKNPKEISLRLREEANKNKVFHSICGIFALRERTRRQISIVNLIMVTRKEGFEFTRVQLEDVLKFLASLGIGRLDYAKKNRLRALKDIRVTLQSIGLAALAKQETLTKFNIPTEFMSLEKPVIESKGIKEETMKVTLLVELNPGHQVAFELPYSVSSRDVILLLSNLKGV